MSSQLSRNAHVGFCDNGQANLRGQISPRKKVGSSIETFNVNNAMRYCSVVIKTFRCPDTEALSKGNPVRRFANLASVARGKFLQIQIADRLDDLRVPPVNRLEALKCNREGQYSIRINDRYRICFRWIDYGAEDIEIVDYH